MSLAVVAAVSGVVVVAARAHPTANRTSDVVIAVAFAVAIPLAASVARTWTWIVLASGAAVMTAPHYLVVGVTLESIALVAAATDVPARRIVGAVIGAGSAQLLVRMGNGPFFGSTALAATALSTPVLVSGWMLTRRSMQHQLRRVGMVVGTLAVGASLVAAFSLVQARTAANQAIGHVRSGLDRARQGDSQGASREMAAAANSFSTAHGDAGSWWTKPAELLPVIGQQVASIDRLTAAGEVAAAAAAKATNEADVNSFRLRSGSIDLAKVSAAAQPLSEVLTALEKVQRAIEASRSPWLIRPLATRIDAFATEVDRAKADTEVAAQAVAVAPALFGGNGARRYFVAFGNPSESRDLGGFVGGYGEMVIANGKLELVRVGKASDLNAGGPHPLSDSSALPERFRSLNLEKFWQNVTGSPDFSTVSEAVRQLWPESGGGPLDGVLYVDPYALSALLRLTGPVTVPGLEAPVSADNIVSFLTRDQYTELKIGDERHDLLSDTAKIVFDKLTSLDLPGPRQVADTLGPATHAGRLLLHSFHADEQQLFATLGIDGAMPAADGDFLAVTASNRGMNKIDSFLTRSTEDEVRVDPSTGRVDATVRVTLRNDAPASGLPDYVIGNDVGLPKGTNPVVISVSTSLALDDAVLGTSPVAIGAHNEYGGHTYTASLAIPSGATQVLELHLHGLLAPGQPYKLTAVPKPNVGTERLTVRVTAVAGGRIGSSQGLNRQGDAVEITEDLFAPREYWVRFTRP